MSGFVRTEATTMPSFPEGASARGGRNAAHTHRQSAREFYAGIIPIVVGLRKQGLSLRAIARELTARGIPLRNWGTQVPWNPQQVNRVLARAEQEALSRASPAVADLLARCRALGVRLVASEDGKLRYSADSTPPR